MPETRDHHVLDRALSTVRQLHRRFLLTLARRLTADVAHWRIAFAGAFAAYDARLRRLLLANSWIAFTRPLAAYAARMRRFLLTLARTAPAFRTRLRFERLAIPFRIAEVLMRLHKVIDSEVILPVIQPRAASDDLLEFDY